MLSQEALKQIDREVAKYPAGLQQSAVMAALRIAQVEKGWLAPETIEFVANYLGMAPIAARWEKPGARIFRRYGLFAPSLTM